MARDTKQSAMNAIADLLGIGRMSIGRGSTEPKEFLDQVAIVLGMNPDKSQNKQKLAEAIAVRLGQPWDATCDSRDRAHSGGGTVTKEGLSRILGGLRDPKTTSVQFFEDQVEDALSSTMSAVSKPEGNERPPRSKLSPSGFVRSPHVAAWVRRHSGGVCSLCGNKAPFMTSRGVPFLETHHVHPLAEGGPDTVANTVALCPNCHRSAHHAEDSSARKQKLLDYLRTRDQREPT
ncbi:MAG: hypothetical protein DWH79_01330 [Planctomycetota bacterium]|nr:MAG: hypothetical protein DWH79_01330 [Planctomycetota bacterium]